MEAGDEEGGGQAKVGHCRCHGSSARTVTLQLQIQQLPELGQAAWQRQFRERVERDSWALSGLEGTEKTKTFNILLFETKLN